MIGDPAPLRAAVRRRRERHRIARTRPGRAGADEVRAGENADVAEAVDRVLGVERVVGRAPQQDAPLRHRAGAVGRDFEPADERIGEPAAFDAVVEAHRDERRRQVAERPERRQRRRHREAPRQPLSGGVGRLGGGVEIAGVGVGRRLGEPGGREARRREAEEDEAQPQLPQVLLDSFHTSIFALSPLQGTRRSRPGGIRPQSALFAAAHSGKAEGARTRRRF